MNIRMLTPDFMPNPFCGIGIYVYNIAKELVKLGNKVTVIIIKGHKYLLKESKKYYDNGILVYDFVEDNKKMTITEVKKN